MFRGVVVLERRVSRRLARGVQVRRRTVTYAASNAIVGDDDDDDVEHGRNARCQLRELRRRRLGARQQCLVSLLLDAAGLSRAQQTQPLQSNGVHSKYTRGF